MKTTFKNGLLALVLAISSGQVLANTTLTVSTWGSPKHGINTIVWPTWDKWIQKATNGRVKLKVVYDLAPPNSQMDTIADGVGDVSWLYHGYYPGRFTTATLPDFPTFQDISSEELSKIYWKVFDKYLKKANEYKGLVVAGVGVHGPGSAHLKSKVTNIKQLAEKRIRVGGGVISEIAKKAKIAGIAMSPTGIYEAASQGVISGAFIDLGALKSFRLAEVFSNTFTLPGGLYRGSFSIVINADKWNKISSKDQAAIMAISGEKLSALFGQMMDIAGKEGVAFAKQKGHTFTKADKASIEAVRKMTANMPKQWLKANANKGFDAQAAMSFYQSLLKK